MKNAVSKILGALVLSNYMTQGAITTTQTVNNSAVSQALQNLVSLNPIPNISPGTPQSATKVNPAVLDIANT